MYITYASIQKQYWQIYCFFFTFLNDLTAFLILPFTILTEKEIINCQIYPPYVSLLTSPNTECSAPLMNHHLFCLVQESGVTWWLSSPAGSPLTCISTVLPGRFLKRPRAATTPAAHSLVQVSTAQASTLTIS